MLVAFEESQLMLEQFAAGSSDDTQDIIQLLQGQVAEVQSVNFNLKAEKEAMNQAIKKMVIILLIENIQSSKLPRSVVAGNWQIFKPGGLIIT